MVEEKGSRSYQNHVVQFQSNISIVQVVKFESLFNIKSNHAHTVFTVISKVQVLNFCIHAFKSHISKAHVFTINSTSST
jgi:hypothetical protein